MKKHFLSAALALFATPALATCSATIPAGSIEMVYCNAESVTTYTPSATISDATAATFIGWCESYFAIGTPQACYNAWFDSLVNSTLATIQSYQAQAAVAAVAKLPINPAQ